MAEQQERKTPFQYSYIMIKGLLAISKDVYTITYFYQITN